jgi:hypothetical protein
MIDGRRVIWESRVHREPGLPAERSVPHRQGPLRSRRAHVRGQRREAAGRDGVRDGQGVRTAHGRVRPRARRAPRVRSTTSRARSASCRARAPSPCAWRRATSRTARSCGNKRACLAGVCKTDDGEACTADAECRDSCTCGDAQCATRFCGRSCPCQYAPPNGACGGKPRRRHAGARLDVQEGLLPRTLPHRDRSALHARPGLRAAALHLLEPHLRRRPPVLEDGVPVPVGRQRRRHLRRVRSWTASGT